MARAKKSDPLPRRTLWAQAPRAFQAHTELATLSHFRSITPPLLPASSSRDVPWRAGWRPPAPSPPALPVVVSVAAAGSARAAVWGRRRGAASPRPPGPRTHGRGWRLKERRGRREGRGGEGRGRKTDKLDDSRFFTWKRVFGEKGGKRGGTGAEARRAHR